MLLLGSKFQMKMAALKDEPKLVEFRGADDAGLYLHRFSGDYGTALAARGTRAELEQLMYELGWPRNEDGGPETVRPGTP